MRLTSRDLRPGSIVSFLDQRSRSKTKGQVIAVRIYGPLGRKMRVRVLSSGELRDISIEPLLAGKLIPEEG